MASDLFPLVCVAVPCKFDGAYPQFSIDWMLAEKYLQFPLGASSGIIFTRNKKIDDARNDLILQAIQKNADYIFFIGQDNIPPQNAFLKLWAHDVDMVTGVYWTKTYPSFPYIWKWSEEHGYMKGPYQDWKAGEYFPIDQAGVDALLVKVDALKRMQPYLDEENKWFDLNWVYTQDQTVPSAQNTEDFYFYTKAAEAGIQLMCDTAVQVGHQDMASGHIFALRADMKQSQPPEWMSPYEGLTIADVGCGTDTPAWPDAARVVRIDGREEVNPDVRCDIRSIPLDDQMFDMVFLRHVLEHFGLDEAPALLAELTRILKVGGQLVVNCPNLLAACREILDQETLEGARDYYPRWQLYGAQSNRYDYHKNGFTPRDMKKLIEMTGHFDNIEVTTEGPNDINLEAKATKTKHPAAPTAIIDLMKQVKGEGESAASANGKPKKKRAAGGPTKEQTEKAEAP